MKLISKLIAHKNPSLIIISLLYVTVGSYLFNKYGVQFVNDSPRYIGYANNLQGGFYYDQLNFWYFSYAIFVYLHQLFSTELLPIILSQYILGYLAVLALYQGCYLLNNSRRVAFIAAVLFILYPDNIFWHSYILTESIYSSFLCISFYCLIKYYRSRRFKDLIFLALSLMLCLFSKPTAPAVLLAISAPFIIGFLRNRSFRSLKITSMIIGVMLTFVLANEMITMHRVMLIYQKGDIVFAMHELPNAPFHDQLTVTPPENLHVPNQDKALLISMLEFVVYNPLFWLKLFLGKLLLFISHIRPYWSWPHIITVLALVWPSYYFAYRSLKKRLIPSFIIVPVIVYCSIHLLIVSNTWVDWDARFFVPLYPLLALIAAVSISEMWDKPLSD